MLIQKIVHCRKEHYDIYIGRGSQWGNPFSHQDGTTAQFRVSSRDEAIACYAKWIMTQPHLLADLPKLKGKTLGCWCQPKKCHGRILSRLANNTMKIAVTGVSSTGKSTLSEAVATKSGLTYMSEQPLLDAAFDYCDKSGVELSTRHMPDFNPDDVAHFERGFLQAKYDWDAAHPSYIADACPMQTIVYLLTCCYKQFGKEEITHHYNRLLAMARTFDIIYYLPFGLIPIVDDGRRITDHNFLLMQDLVLRGLLSKHEDELTVVELGEKDLTKRINFVMTDVRQLVSAQPPMHSLEELVD